MSGIVACAAVARRRPLCMTQDTQTLEAGPDASYEALAIAMRGHAPQNVSWTDFAIAAENPRRGKAELVDDVLNPTMREPPRPLGVAPEPAARKPVGHTGPPTLLNGEGWPGITRPVVKRPGWG